MMREPKTEPIPAPDPATPTVAAPDQKDQKCSEEFFSERSSESALLTSSDELGCRVNVRLGGRGGEEVGSLKSELAQTFHKKKENCNVQLCKHILRDSCWTCTVTGLMLLRAAKERRGETAMRAMADIFKLCKCNQFLGLNFKAPNYTIAVLRQYISLMST